MSEEFEQAAGTPRWVKVFGIVAVVVAVLVVVLVVAGRGGHGPGRHAPDGDAAGVRTGPLPAATRERR